LIDFLKIETDLLSEPNRAFNVTGAAVPDNSTMCRHTRNTRHTYMYAHSLIITDTSAADAVYTNCMTSNRGEWHILNFSRIYSNRVCTTDLRRIERSSIPGWFRNLHELVSNSWWKKLVQFLLGPTSN